MSRCKRLFALLLTLTMMIVYMPSPVFSATDENTGSSEVAIGSGDVSTGEETNEGITPANPGDPAAGENITGADQTISGSEVTKIEENTATEKAAEEPTAEPVTLNSKNTGSTEAAKASGTTKNDVSGSKSASPTELTSKQRVTEVTLSMPSAEAHEEYDVVFAMDSSSSTANNNIDFSLYVKDFLDELIAKDAVIKVGVVKARGRAFDTIKLASNEEYSGLVEYSGDTEAAILAGVSFKEADLKALSSGTNMHGALDMANDMLEADGAVADDHKFVILLMDGKTYIWNNDNDEPTSYYTQYMAKGVAYGVPAVGQQTGAYTKSAYKHKDKYYYTDVTDTSKCFYYSDFADLYASGNEELGKTDTKYDHYCAYADKKGSVAGGTSTAHDVTNGGQFTYIINKKYYEFTPTDEWSDLNYLEAAPYEIIKNDDGTYTYDLDKPNPDFYQVHPDSLQKGLYLTAKLWEKMNTKYTTGAIIFSGWPGGSGLEIAKSFDTWIKGKGISDYAAEITDADQVKTMFDSIKEDIIYMVASGTLTDKIPSEFSLVKSGTDTFKLTVGGESLPAAADGSNAWNFGTPNDQGVYPYRIEYDEAANSFDWIINVPIENAKKLELKYKLAIDEDAAEGLHDTNVSAVLNYVTSKGETGKYEFEKPEVNYKLDKDYTLTINYVYSGGGTAAPSYKATLKGGANYGPINSPAITGYKPNRASVSGVMPEGNVTINVVYSAIPGDDDNPGGGGPTITPTPTPDPGDGPDVPDAPTPQAAPPTTTITDPEPPLAAGAWALINLICAILTALGAIIALFRRKEEEDEDEDESQNAYKAEEEEDEDDNRGKKMLAAKIAGALAGVAAPIVFFLTEDMTLPMQLIDKWTLLMVIILAVQIVAAVFNKKASELDDDEEEEDAQPAY